mmetsp:Transcript_37768/g.108867  ORF Transcript_37768/g.108867 Transcript_37768/m.108867 type:complete len:127 (+) Transcript_37768:894-1274(+)
MCEHRKSVPSYVRCVCKTLGAGGSGPEADDAAQRHGAPRRRAAALDAEVDQLPKRAKPHLAPTAAAPHNTIDDVRAVCKWRWAPLSAVRSAGGLALEDKHTRPGEATARANPNPLDVTRVWHCIAD